MDIWKENTLKAHHHLLYASGFVVLLYAGLTLAADDSPLPRKAPVTHLRESALGLTPRAGVLAPHPRESLPAQPGEEIGSSSLHLGPGGDIEIYDVYPCGGGDGIVEIGDVLGILDAYSSIYACSCPGGGGGGWGLTGNAGTNPATDFVGTSDNVAFSVRVNNQRVMRYEPDAMSPNVIGGYNGNFVTGGIIGATIGGGGASGGVNTVTGNYGTVGGGELNSASGLWSTVGGGTGNTAAGSRSVVAGGQGNSASVQLGSVLGGESNTASGSWSSVGGGGTNVASNQFATVAGGSANSASGSASFVGGGEANSATVFAASICGGYTNSVTGPAGTLSGGDNNTVSGTASMIGRGYKNVVSGAYSVVGGGHSNLVSASYGTIAGGGSSDPGDPIATRNKVLDDYGTIGGGAWNQVGDGAGTTADRPYATIAGGWRNLASGGRSAICGGYNNSASGSASIIGGGQSNTASGDSSTVGGGLANTASNSYSTVPGGVDNTASGFYSFAAGRRAQAVHTGVFVWADSTSADFTSRGPDQFLIRAAGGVGIGTNDPTAKVHVVGGSDAGVPYTGGYVAFGATTGPNVAIDDNEIMARNNGATAPLYVNKDGADVVIGGFAGTTRVGIMDTTPDVALDVIGDINYTGVITDVSDERLKENITPVPNALAKLGQLRGVYFTMKDTPEQRDVGLIAQDVQAVLPEAVRVVDAENGYLGVSYSSVIPLLIEAIKETQSDNLDAAGAALAAIQGLHQVVLEKDCAIVELQSEISDLRSQNADVANRNVELEARLARIERMIGVAAPSTIGGE